MSRKMWCALGLLLLAPVLRTAAASAGKQNWDRLQQLRPGELIQVERRGAEPFEASFGAATADRLQVVRNRNEQLDLSRAEVLRVYRVRKGARAAGPIVGAAVGFGVGFGIGYAAGAGKGKWWIGPSKPEVAGVTGLIGASVGTGIGFLVRGKSRELIYQLE